MKHFHRYSAMALALVLAASLMAVNASASSPVNVYQDVFIGPNCTFDTFWQRLGTYDSHSYDSSEKQTIKASDYEKYIHSGDEYYEMVGMNSTMLHENICNKKESMEVPAYPINGTMAEQDAWYKLYGDITIAYIPHEHDMTDAPWRFDNNYHWKNCTECGRRVFLRWHSDHDENGVCDLCGMEIKYYNVTVKDAPGGKVTLSAEKGEMNDRIGVTVTPDAGYHLQSIKFFNNNEQHSQLTRYEDKAGSEYHFVILNWDIDVEAVFEKD